MWFFDVTLDFAALLAALQQTLAAYPVLCGRYASPPSAIELSNVGVPVQICTASPDTPLSEALAPLPTSSSRTSPIFFSRAAHEIFVPTKEDMDPDLFSPDAPLLKVKITLFPSGGTAIGVLLQHSIVDADAEMAFVRNWSRVFRGLNLDPTPKHDRCAVDRLWAGELASGIDPGQDNTFKIKAVPIEAPSVPEFMGVLPMIGGDQVCVVPFPASALREMKAAACHALPGDQFVSTDDILAARAWQALCAMRCSQLGISSDSEAITTVSRACNVRQRTVPSLGTGFFGNAATQVWTELTVGDLLSMSPADVAQRLRTSLQAFQPEVVAARALWLHQKQHAGFKTTLAFDPDALTFIISSWRFDWEGADFNAKPLCFHHGAHTPVVAVILPRALGDGLNLYASGPRESLDQFAHMVTQNSK
eukprot:gene18593-22200_t